MPTEFINYKKMVNQFVGDVDLFNRFANKFLSSFETLIGEIEAALSNRNQESLKKLVHSYKNAMCNFHAEKAYEKVVALEKMAESGAFDEFVNVFNEVKREAYRVAEEIRWLMNQKNPMDLSR